jgi:hypothetical protein
MNKSILIVVCDFLVLSLLSLAKFDETQMDKKPDPKPVVAAASTQSDLMDALQTALEQEKKSREQLQSELEKSRTQVKTQEQLLAEREANLQKLQENLKQTETVAQQLSQERQALDQQVTASVRSIVDLENQLNTATTETKVSQARLDALQAELKMREREADRLRERMSKVEEQQKATESDKQQLALKLQATETEKKLVREQLEATKQQVAQVNQEKEQIRQEKQEMQEHAKALAQGVSALAEKSGELTEQLREARPLTGNTIFSGFISNRVDSEFTARKGGLLGQSGNTRTTKTVLVSSGGQVYAIYHAQDTLLNVAAGQTGWDYVYGSLRHGFALISLDTLSFLQADPRIVIAPITAEQAKELGVAVYPLATEPFKFNLAVLVGGAEGYYGEAPFQLDPDTPKYVHMQKERFSKLFGKFTPSRGDLVFSRTGEVLGIMANDEFCLVLDDLKPAGTVSLGARIQDPKNAQVLSNVGFRVSMLPAKVQ